MTIEMTAKTPSLPAIARLKELSGESVKLCMQCATCTGMCPMAQEMDISPRRVMHLAQFGLLDRLDELELRAEAETAHD